MAATATQNVFVVGLNDFNLRKLQGINGAENYAYHGLLSPEEILEARSYPVADMIERAAGQLSAFDGSVDAIVGYMDFPVSTMLPLLRRPLGLPGATLESVLKCEHKYWSRLEQQRVVPDVTPAFEAFDPFDEASLADIDLAYPFWVKPIKSAGSWLGFRVGDARQLEHAAAMIRSQIARFGDPFDYILGQAELPAEVASVGGNWCLAEQIIGGRQVTVEGYVHKGTVRSHGIVDSVLYPGTSSFLRYQYPSSLPPAVQSRMVDGIERLLTAIGYDDSAFNIEYFYDDNTDQLWLLEINTRVAQHHSELFEKVDGVSNHQVTVDVALGQEPRMPRGEGPFRCAAACWLRRWQDGVVRQVPSPQEIAQLEESMAGVTIELEVRTGMRLSEAVDQDSYSYVLALIYIGGADEADVVARYEQCVRELHFVVEDV